MKGFWHIILSIILAFVWQHERGDAASSKNIVAAYWGQNSVSHKIGINSSDYEKPLDYFCRHSTYDVILISFMNEFFDIRNKDNFPSLNLANHCSSTVSAQYPYLLKCPTIGAAVKKCQANGKKVLLSMGGASGNYSIPNNTKAVELARRVWSLFLGGQQYPSYRPFGDAILDGLDLDIENKNTTGYAAFTVEMRRLMATDSSKSYLITAAPQCPFPDQSLGPISGSVLQAAGHLIDYLFVQYYNNYCYPGGGSFQTNVQVWFNWTESILLTDGKAPKVIIGLPAGLEAAVGNQYFKSVQQLENIINITHSNNHFGGMMLWDAGWDQNQIINGKRYSEHIRGIMDSLSWGTGGNGGTGGSGGGGSNDACHYSISAAFLALATILSFLIYSQFSD